MEAAQCNAMTCEESLEEKIITNDNDYNDNDNDYNNNDNDQNDNDNDYTDND